MPSVPQSEFWMDKQPNRRMGNRLRSPCPGQEEGIERPVKRKDSSWQKGLAISEDPAGPVTLVQSRFINLQTNCVMFQACGLMQSNLMSSIVAP